MSGRPGPEGSGGALAATRLLALFAVTGSAFWIAVTGALSDLPGAGPTTPVADAWAPVARAAVVIGAPLALLALLVAVVAAWRAGRRPGVPEAATGMVLALHALLLWLLASPDGGAAAGTLSSIVRVLALLVSLTSISVCPRRQLFSWLLTGAGVALGLIALILGGEAFGVSFAPSDLARLRAAVMATILTAAGVIGLRRRA